MIYPRTTLYQGSAWWKAAFQKMMAERIGWIDPTPFWTVLLDHNGLERGRWFSLNAKEATATARAGSCPVAYAMVNGRITLFKDGVAV